MNVDLEGRTEIIRVKETNLGNFFCDIILSATGGDCSLLNAGFFRSDRVHPAGDFKLKDLNDILSFDADLSVTTVTGSQLHQVLENGVAKFNEGGGRFPQVSGIFFAFDPTKKPGNRIDPRLIKIKNEYMVKDQVIIKTSIL